MISIVAQLRENSSEPLITVSNIVLWKRPNLHIRSRVQRAPQIQLQGSNNFT